MVKVKTIYIRTNALNKIAWTLRFIIDLNFLFKNKVHAYVYRINNKTNKMLC